MLTTITSQVIVPALIYVQPKVMNKSTVHPGTITRYANAWIAGDRLAVADIYDENIVVHYGGTSSFAGNHHGRNRFIEVLLETSGRAKRQLIAIDQIHDDGDTGALFVTESIELDGETIAVSRALRFRVANDRIVECWLFDHDQHLIDRAWSQT
jgi:uncharacterized protein